MQKSNLYNVKLLYRIVSYRKYLVCAQRQSMESSPLCDGSGVPVELIHCLTVMYHLAVISTVNGFSMHTWKRQIIGSFENNVLQV